MNRPTDADQPDADQPGGARSPDDKAVGRVASVRSYPVKSMDAEPCDSTEILTSGVEHDRGWAVLDTEGQVVSARTAPVLRQVRAGRVHADGPALVLPGSDLPVRAASADAALSHLVGRPVTVRPATGTGPGFNEVAAVHLVSRQAVAAARAATPDVDCADPACSVEEPRANLVLDLDGEAGGLEQSWVGQQVRVGEAVLRVTRQPEHCLGVYAEVVRPGRVSVGDVVRVS